jgi:acyl-coenzyme A thioesterase PaaI-like protein
MNFNLNQLKNTFKLRLLGLFKIPMIFFVGPKIIELDENHCVVKIPLNYRTKNHLNSLYFGALAVGADIAGGLIAVYLLDKLKIKASLVFKSFKANFLKRPLSDTYFECIEGVKVQSLIEKIKNSNERHHEILKIDAYTYENNIKTLVAQFEIELSLKRKI